MFEDINRVTIIGEVSGEVDYRKTVHGTSTAQFTLGVKGRMSGDMEKVHFFDVVVWGRSAEKCAHLLEVGSKVAVDGSLEQLRWVSPSGYNRSKVEIRSKKIDIISRPEEEHNMFMNNVIENQSKPEPDLFPLPAESVLF